MQDTVFIGDAIAALGYTMRAGWNVHCVLRRVYTGALFRVRRGDNNLEQDIGSVNGLPDVAALSAFCSGTSGFVVSIYDQSDNGRTITQATASQQMKIYDSVTGPVVGASGYLALQATRASAMRYQRADTCGISGDVSYTALLDVQHTESSVHIAWGMGGAGSQGHAQLNTFAGSDPTRYTWSGSIGGTNASRTLQGTTMMNRSVFVQTRVAGTTASTLALRQNGVALSEVSVTNGSLVPIIGTGNTTIGSTTLGTVQHGTGQRSHLMLFSGALSDSAAQAYEAWAMARL